MNGAYWTLKLNIDGLVKSPKTVFFVIPAKAGIQWLQQLVDSGVRRSDGFRDFLRVHQYFSMVTFSGFRVAAAAVDTIIHVVRSPVC
jgi:hypothetical protein